MRYIVFFIIVFSLFFISCASSKLAKQEDAETLTEFTLGMVENFSLTPAMLDKMQFFSGNDTLVLSKSIKVATGSVASDGTLMLTGGEPTKKALILPNTPGTIAPKGIIFGKDKKIEKILVSFSDNQNNALSFVPYDDEFGTFKLDESDNNMNVKNLDNQVLMIKLFYLEQQDQSKVEPGRLVGQKNNIVNEKKVPDKKFVRNN